MKRTNFLILVMFLLLCLLAGCTDTQLAQTQAEKDRVDAQIAVLVARATTMPADTKGREELLNATVEAQKYSMLLQGLINDYRARQVTPEGVGAALNAIPGVGPYSNIIILLMGMAGSLITGWKLTKDRANAQMAGVLGTWHNEGEPGVTPALASAITLTGIQPAGIQTTVKV